MQPDPFYAAFADAALNSCAFCKHCQYIADERLHFCMLRKIEVLPEQPACAKRSSISKNKHINK
jgi:hypothetical protein